MAQTSTPTPLLTALDPLLVAEIRRLELRAKRALSHDLVGNYRSAFHGSGLVYADLREYQPGDEPKHIHWKVTARTQKVYVKAYQEERSLNLILVVDRSASMRCGRGRDRATRAAEFAALIGILAQANNDALGLCLFDSGIQEYVPARRRRRQLERVLLTMLHRDAAEQSQSASSNLSAALDEVRRHQRKSATLFIVSDFFCELDEQHLTRLAKQHDVILVLLEDAFELNPPAVGIIEAQDAESGEIVALDLGSARVRRDIQAAHEGRVRDVAEVALRAGADLVRLSDSLRPLFELMERRRLVR